MSLHPDQRTFDRLRVLAEVFRPAGPITEEDLFSGRLAQLSAVTSVIFEKGRHGAIFGERGVGKTSLAAVCAHLTALRLHMRLNCDASDNFASLWQKVVDELVVMSRTQRFSADDKALMESAIELLNYDEVGPDRVRHALRLLTEVGPIAIFLDEFDRISEPTTSAMLADTIKTLSDQLVDATLIVVGVADDVDSLIANHRSIERALVQIPMPRMTTDEVEDIITRGFSRLDLKISPHNLYRLAHLPQGLPHFAHLLAKAAASLPILRNDDEVREEDIRQAIATAINDADESMTQAYLDATASSQQTLYVHILLACALAKGDELGFFTPGDLRGPLRRITGETYDIPRYSRHLVQFCNERGPILERRGGERRWRYRFVNPMMRPYVVMRAVDAGISEDVLEIAPGPSEPERLF